VLIGSLSLIAGELTVVVRLERAMTNNRKTEDHESCFPTEQDFDPTGRDPDARWAWVNFGNLTIKEAEQKLRERGDMYAEAFDAMGGKAFAFYFPAIDGHLRSVPLEHDENADFRGTYIGDDYAALGFCHAICRQFERDDRYVKRLAPQVIELSLFVLQNIDRFGCDIHDKQQVADAWLELKHFLESMTQ
jgi:hypothetical protein